MKIVIPMLGRGSRFAQTGIREPKLLIPIKNRLLFEWATIAIADFNLEKNGIFIILQEHKDDWGLDTTIKQIVGQKTTVVVSKTIPSGAARTVLLVNDRINSAEELIIYNSDQYFKAPLKKFINEHRGKLDGVVPYFHATHPRWSYIETDENENVIRVAEKEVISNKATVGFYYFRHGRDFVSAAEAMIRKRIMIGGDYYVCPVYNELIALKKKIKGFYVNQMWSLGTPEDVERFDKYFKMDI